MEKTECKGCPCHRMTGVFIVLFGLTFLLGALGYLSASTVNIIWPSFVILAGLKAMAKGMCKCCDKG